MLEEKNDLSKMSIEELLQLDKQLQAEQQYESFKTFIAYNSRDVEVLVKLDDKFKFIALTNQMAHENTVDFSAVLGTVQYVETGITNHAHNVLKKVVHDKVISNHDKVEGAIVLTPNKGLHEWIGSVDINSLYPNVIRSLNISPEKVIGQFTNVIDEEDWEAIARGDMSKRCTLILESGEQDVRSAYEWKQWLIDSKYALSAYGTVFDQSNGRGVVPDILGFWYTERKRLQAEKKKYAKLAKDEKDPAKKLEYTKLEEHYDLLQLTKKIAMNSLYGALLNSHFRFGREELGASVTACGRRITKHMIEHASHILTGEHAELKKIREVDKDGVHILYSIDSPAVIYSDTDSLYFRCMGACNKEEAILIADETAKLVNDSFPHFMRAAFNCRPGFDDLIKAGREIVAVRGLFQAKKKYMVKVVDLEGVAVDKMKSQGSEIKKADTPKIIQKFLKHTVDMILDGQKYDDVATYVNQQRKAILKNEDNLFLLGNSKQVNNLDKFYAEYRLYEASGIRRVNLPGHVRAAINYNEMIYQLDKGAKAISSGDKILIFYLKKNQFNLESIAIPAEMTKFPSWFGENFEVDIKKTEQKMFDAKLGGVFAAIGKDVPTYQSVHLSSIIEF